MEWARALEGREREIYLGLDDYEATCLLADPRIEVVDWCQSDGKHDFLVLASRN